MSFPQYAVIVALRYLRLLCTAFCYTGFYLHKIRTTATTSKYTTKHATIVCPSVDAGPGFVAAVKSWLASDPHSVIVVTTDTFLLQTKSLLSCINDDRLKVYAISITGKRPALLEGIRLSNTPIVCLVDDDILWSSKTLEGLLTALSQDNVGGVTPIKIRGVDRELEPCTVYSAMGAARQDRRSVINACMSYTCDQVLVCTGRTSAYRAEILQDARFEKYFCKDYWHGKYLQRSGDDASITRWVYKNGWKTAFLSDSSCAITSTPKSDGTYLKQLIRWSRNHARSDVRDIGNAFSSKSSWHSACCRNLFLFGAIGEDYLLLLDFLSTLLNFLFASDTDISKSRLFSHYVLSNAALETFANLWHFVNYPDHLRHLPVLALYGHLRIIMMIYAFCTMTTTKWLTRAGAD